ncbi:MAG: type II secretion system GspH family protein [Deltaproteobacteria bacterium]|nr:type II secretion system GspH family protein [Deltaproteobacteria bacterium]
MRSNRGFTLIELAVVLFILGLMLWLVAPRLSAFVEPDRNAVFRELSAGSEAAFELALFEKKEVRLALDPVAGTYRFRVPGDTREPPPPRPLGKALRIAGIRVNGEDRPLDIPTEITYSPGGGLPDARIFIRDTGTEGKPTDWTLRISPVSGTIDVLEGTVQSDG